MFFAIKNEYVMQCEEMQTTGLKKHSSIPEDVRASNLTWQQIWHLHRAAEGLDTPMGPNSKFWLEAHNLSHWLLKRHDIRMKLPFANYVFEPTT